MTQFKHGEFTPTVQLKLEMDQLLEQRDALLRQLREIKRQQLQLMQRAARIRLQLAQRELSEL